MTWLLLDCNFLCYRAFYSMGQLSYKEIPTGVLFGFFRDLSSFEEIWSDSRFIFCWDFGPSIRKTISTEYKANRKEKHKDEKLIKLALKRQIREIRINLIHEIGFKNNFYFMNYEADDIMCRLCEILPKQDDIVMITADNDLLQCLSANVVFYNPIQGKTLTLHGFLLKYGIDPSKWSLVKAIAGCSSDNVTGVKGVGEKTAIKYLNGDLKQTTKAFSNIENEKDLIKHNLKMTKLPWKSIRKLLSKNMIREDERSQEAWKTVMKKYGIKTLNSRSSRHGKIKSQRERKREPVRARGFQIT